MSTSFRLARYPFNVTGAAVSARPACGGHGSSDGSGKLKLS